MWDIWLPSFGDVLNEWLGTLLVQASGLDQTCARFLRGDYAVSPSTQCLPLPSGVPQPPVGLGRVGRVV